MAALIAVSALLVVGVAPASAATEHVFSFSFGSSGSGAGQLSSPQDVAVNDTTGDIYVADTGNRRVDEFDSSGNFVAAWGDDVDQTTGGDICTAASGDTCQAGTSSSAPGGFETPTFVAVDDSGGSSDGDVYVGDQGDDLVTKFTADGSVVSSWGDASSPADGQLNGSSASGGPFASIAGITVDSSGNLYVYDDSDHNWFEFAQDGTADPTVTVGKATNEVGIGVDSDGNLYKVRLGYVYQFSSSGSQVGNVTDDQIGTISGFAIDPTTNDIFADDQGGAGGNSLIRHYDGSTLSSCVPADDCVAADTFGSGQLSSSAAGVGFDAATGAVYVADPGNEDVAVFTALTLADVTTGQASGITSTGATLNGTVDADGTTITDCHFEYVAASGYEPSASDAYSSGSTAPCSTTPSGSSAVAISASVSGLTPGMTYDFRLVASNANGTSYGSNATLVTPGASVTGESVTDIGSTSATVFAGVNPNGTDTSYQFQYGTSDCTSGGCTSVPATAVDIGSGSSVAQVSQQLSGLAAGTTYHYRVVAATNSGITTDGPDQTFTTTAASAAACSNASLRTGASAALPDCRAYEQVSPAGSHPYLDQTTTTGDIKGVQAADTGNGIGWYTLYPVSGAQSDGFFYLSTRGSSGWSTVGLVPPQSVTSSAQDECYPSVFLSADLSAEVLADGFDVQGNSYGGSCGADDPQLVSGEPQGQENLFSSMTSSGSYQLLNAPLSSGASPANAEFEDASSDFGDVVFEDQAQLTSGAISGGMNLYDWTGGKVSLVSVLPDGTATTGTIANATVYTAAGDNEVGAGSFTGDAPFTGAVSSDGSRVFFQGTDGDLYVRENPTAPQSPVSNGSCTDSADACTVQIDASHGSGSGGGGTFEWASSDGSLVVFADGPGLTSDSMSGSGENLYEYDVDTGALTDLTAGATAEAQGVTAMSTDGSYLYFVADGVLATGATSGEPNLYVNHDGTTIFIATLSSSDSADWSDPSGNSSSVEASPNGEFMVFDSSASLTGYDNSDQSTGEADDEIYLYDAGTGKLSCASCDPSGAQPTGRAEVSSVEQMAPVEGAGYQSRVVLDDGRVFFDASDALLPGATNGQSNVYESEPDGVGSCVQTDGCLYLISGGTSTNGSYFYDASASGDDVFFVSTQDLTGSDSDETGISIYDAKVGGGFPAGSGTPVACLSSQTCEGSASSAPSTPTVGSVTFMGPGDQKTTAKTVVGKVEVTKRAVKSDSFRLTVKVPAKGKITITGADVKRLLRSVRRAGSYKLTVDLTGKAIARLKPKRRLRVELKVAYRSAAGGSSSVLVSMIVKAG